MSLDIMAEADTNQDGHINLGDNIDGAHLEAALEHCDNNDDGSIELCEV
jgi:Ca2+-binding EF-hand superfamily protein